MRRIGPRSRRGGVIYDYNADRGGFFRRGGVFYSLPVIIVADAFGNYSQYYGSADIDVVGNGTQTSSNANVETVAPPPLEEHPASAPPESKIVELPPPSATEENQTEESADERSGEEQSETPQPQQEVEVLAAGSPVEFAERPTLYLVALKSGIIHTSQEHWLEGETLHYTTIKGEHWTAPLAEVDLDFTRQLNAERNLPFVLELRPPSQTAQP